MGHTILLQFTLLYENVSIPVVLSDYLSQYGYFFRLIALYV